MKSYKVEVFVDNEWCSNSCRFATEKEAETAGRELLSRWFVPSDSQATETTDPVNYRFNFEAYRPEPIK